jgi:hypothetical protein
LWRPVLEGLWRQHELWDKTYTVDDLVDVNEALDLKAVNERLYEVWCEENRK